MEAAPQEGKVSLQLVLCENIRSLVGPGILSRLLPAQEPGDPLSPLTPEEDSALGEGAGGSREK